MANQRPGIGLSGAMQEAMNKGSLYSQMEGRDPKTFGVFSAWPFMSPKYAKHTTNRQHEFTDTMARMFISVPSKLYQKFLSSLADPVTRQIAKALTGDDAGKGGVGYIDFLLQNAVHDFNEKVQIVETLSDSYVAFFFGHKAPIFNYQGTLLNTYQDDWAMRMFRIFRDLGRGTQLARRKLILRIRYDSMIVSGAMLNFNWGLNAGMETACPFQFNLLVKNIQVFLGGLSNPTDLINEKHFAPNGFHLENPNQIDQPASKTRLDCPETGLEGAGSVDNPAEGESRERDEWEYDVDVCGTPYREPDQPKENEALESNERSVPPEAWEEETQLEVTPGP